MSVSFLVRNALALLASALLLFGTSRLGAAPPAGEARLLIVVGAPGEEEFTKPFTEWAERWRSVGEKGGAQVTVLGRDISTSADTDLKRLKEAILAEPPDTSAAFWLVMIGHGTFNGKEARFNLRGPDLLASELATLLQPFRRPTAIINTFSTSAPFLSALSATGRVVITSTRSGSEHNYSRLGGYLSDAIGSMESDLDKDGQTSLLEAFLMAARRMEEFYAIEGRLATEHPLLDDNGDGLGTPPDWFAGVRAIKKAKEGATVDGRRAHQFHLVHTEAEKKLGADVRRRRDKLETTLLELRDKKTEIAEADYYSRLEAILLELARLYIPKPADEQAQ